MISLFFDLNAILFVLSAVIAGVLIFIKKERKIHYGIKTGLFIVLIVTQAFLIITLADLSDMAVLGKKLSFILLSNFYMSIILAVEKIIYYSGKTH